MIEQGFEPVEIDNRTFQIHSQSNDKQYNVLHKYNAWYCNCPDYLYRKIECKHIHAIRFWQELKNKLVAEQPQEITVELIEEIGCVYCGCEEIVKHGTRSTKVGAKTRMWCKGCNHTFTLQSDAGFEKMQVTSKMVTVALDLYFKGTSLRKIVDHLEQFYERKVDHITVLYWVKKYTSIISEFAETLNPKLGGIWHADEMKVKTKRDEWSWLWHVMDSETRFMVANLVTKKREVGDAQELFKEAREAGNAFFVV
jgi:transposase-like protein